MNKYVLTEKEIKSNFSKILIEIYNCCDLKLIYQFCNKHNYKMVSCLHLPEEDGKKVHTHVLIVSDSKHRFNIKSLLNDTLVIYNFMKTDTSVVDFVNYVQHNDYDMKRKYRFEMVYFNKQFTYTGIKNIRNSLERTEINTIEDEDVYNINNLYKLLFDGYFQSFIEIIEFCRHTDILRRHFVNHSRQLSETFTLYFDKGLKTFEEQIAKNYLLKDNKGNRYYTNMQKK